MFDQKLLEGTLWLAEETRFRLALDRLSRIAACPTAREIVQARRQALEDAQAASKRAIKASKGKIGVIPIFGPIEQRVSSPMMKLCGTSCEEVSIALDVLLNDPSVDSIVFHIDSPGGSSYGVEELSDKIHAARGKKKMYAFADSLMASAAYWIGTAAETVIVTPGGDVGSVGVYAVHVDESKMLADEGINITLIKSGKFKAELASHVPLTEEARDYLQEMVDLTAGKFHAALKRNRSVSADAVRKSFGEGRLVPADKALEAGMVDRIMPFDQFMGKLTGSTESGKKASAEVLRLAQEQRKRKLWAGV